MNSSLFDQLLHSFNTGLDLNRHLVSLFCLLTHELGHIFVKVCHILFHMFRLRIQFGFDTLNVVGERAFQFFQSVRKLGNGDGFQVLQLQKCASGAGLLQRFVSIQILRNLS